MLKKIIFTSLFLFSAQNVMALNLDDVNNAANNVSATTETAQEVTDKAEKVNEKSISDMTKQVATDSAEGGVKGAVDSAASGSIVEGGSKGALKGAQTSLNKL